ncbi:signal peptidase I [Nocardioides sp. T2.26MG-1]|uniref:signal peptidase I n=1 Tax=Nocardioides sp. T2.26MG-1 TaxID=3041166 RepID=UPI0025413920|nr:signal peptidase I [Nocardioides sp. T2.26MG-1]
MTSGKRRLTWWQESLLMVGIAVVLALVIKTLFVQAFYIPSPSMVPGLVKNDRILVEKPSYWFGGPQRGDVVVFEDPGDWLPPQDKAGPTNPVAKLMTRVGLYPTGDHLVKRVIGVAGDVISCCDEQGRLLVNGHPLDEDDYVNEAATTDCRGPEGPGGEEQCEWTAGPVPDGHLFVMGDNRYHSADSSYHLCDPSDDACNPDDAYVDDDLVVGRVFAVVWPRDHITWLHRPDTLADVPDSPPRSQ